MEKFTIKQNEKTVLKTIRIDTKLLNKIDNLSSITNVSINSIINQAIKFSLEYIDFKDLAQEKDLNSQK